MKSCTKCGVELTEENCYHSDLLRQIYRCKECRKTVRRAHWRKNRDVELLRARLYNRNYSLGLGGKMICGVIKRKWSGRCELCNRSIESKNASAYHHWDDSDVQKGKFVKGVWACRDCHVVIELVDKQLLESIVDNYVKLKEGINNLV